ncbi:MAG TPA: HEAT repeat domain-containing protein [Actinomycetota bacterium]|nr:HEAT repeat domain-containing protein [Actinomycetota bacterium]
MSSTDVRALRAERDISGLVEALRDPDQDVVRAASWALTRLEDAGGVPYLVGALDDPGAALPAARLLGRLGDPAAVEPLLAAFEHGPNDLRVAAADALGALDDARAVGPLAEALERDDPEVANAAGRALGRIDDARATDALERVFAGTRSTAAAVGLAAARHAVALPFLYERLATGEPSDPDTAAAALAIAEVGDARALGPLLETMRRAQGGAKCPYVRAAGLLGDTRAIPPLLGLMMSYGLCVATVLEALGRIGDPRALGPVLDALEDDRAGVRAAAIKALGAIGDPRTLDALRRVLERPDLDAESRLLAEDAIGDIEGLAAGDDGR